jgi:hypothetical protein
MGYGNGDPGNWDFWTEQNGGRSPEMPAPVHVTSHHYAPSSHAQSSHHAPQTHKPSTPGGKGGGY